MSRRPSPSSRASDTRRFAICACAEASSEESGSSRTSTDGSAARARAIAIRWRWPPLNWCGYREAALSAEPDLLEELVRTASPVAAVSLAEGRERVGDLASRRAAAG